MNFPKRVTIELTNHCNRSCEGCPRHKTTYPLGYMQMSLFNKVVEQLPRETVIVPFFRGESLLHSQFADAMKKLQRFKQVQLATNGDMFNPSTTEAIVQACSFVSLSLHTLHITPTLKEKAFFLAAKNEDVTTQVSILETLIPKQNKHQFIQSWLKVADRVRIYEEHSHIGFGDVRNKTKDNGEPCQKPFNELVAYWDGMAGLCNHDWNNQTFLGNLNTESIHDVWCGQAYNNVRHYHEIGERRQVKACEHCNYYDGKLHGELHEH